MTNKVLGITLIIIVFGTVFIGIFDPAVYEPHPNPIIDKLEIILGVALIIVCLLAGIRLIRSDKKTTPST